MAAKLTQVGNPRLVIMGFIARRSLHESLIWAFIFALTVVSSAFGFLTAFPSAQDKAHVALSFGTNIGLKAMLGEPAAIDTVAGFTQWRALGIIILIGSLWGMMLATKLFRGDEEDGRLELLLSGVTSQRTAAAQILGGIGLSLLALILVAFGITAGVGARDSVGISAAHSLLLALAMAAPPAMFIAVGALASQLAATRRQALRLSAVIFGLSFITRALADSTADHAWVRKLSPMGWVEELQVLTGAHLIWFLPIILFIVAVSGLAIWLAGRRDLGDSYLKEADSAKPNYHFLNGTGGLALRLTGGGVLGWIGAIGVVASAFGGVAKSAAQAFAASTSIQSFLGHFSASTSDNAATFLGIIFMVLMTVTMVMTAGNLGGIREEEASSHLDYLLVRPVSRLQWLAGRVGMALVAILGSGAAIGIGSWAMTHAQGLDIGFSRLFLAGLNAVFPAIFVLGFGILIFGLAPRLVSPASYGLVAFSFLIQFLASALNAKEWLLNLSVMHHVTLAPAVDPDWTKNWQVAAVGLALALLGAWAFNRRDTATE